MSSPVDKLGHVQPLQTLDNDLFRFINGSLANPLFDGLMPFLSGNAFFYPILFLAGVVLIWKGGKRGLICVLLLALILPMGDHWICRVIKKSVERPRPFSALADVRLPASRKDPDAPKPPASVTAAKPTPALNSMPSSHAANWFAALMVAYVYYRPTIRFMFPAAFLVGFSRIYNGVHYPSDVVAGAILGAGYAAASLWALEAFWRSFGRKWFPLWWSKMPSILAPSMQLAEGARPSRARLVESEVPHGTPELQWLRLGYLMIAILLVARLVYIAGDTLLLTGDEAYQWLWSKHLALSYYSKPPVIAYAQFFGTAIFGDTTLGVRFFSPVSAALLSFLLLRFFAREFNARAGFFLLLITTATPLVAAGAVLMTVDVFLVLFWTLAMIAGWRAVQRDSTVAWLWVGLWMGLAFLSKYTALLQWVCWLTFFILWPEARRQLRRPGPYLALLINFVCALPVLIWNQQHQWITVRHVAEDAKAGEPWDPAVLDFLGTEAVLFNPVFFIAIIWAAFAFWQRSRHNPKLVYLFSMGAPLFLVYFFYSIHSRIQPNWIAASVLPLFCFMVGYWDTQWRLGNSFLKPFLIAGLAIGLPLVIIGHDTEILGKLTGHFLPVNQDPLHRARGWKEVAKVTAAARSALMTEGKPVFIITDHYRLAGELSFYLPEAQGAGNRLVYRRTRPEPIDQFYFWPDYSTRKGENAIFILELNRNNLKTKEAPMDLCKEFDSVQDLGVREVLDHKRLLWRLQLYACRGLK